MANPTIRPRLDARPDRLDLRDLPYRPPLRSLPPRWPLDTDLKRFLPGYLKAGLILNQGNEGACTGFGLACVTNYLYFLRHLEEGSRSAPASVSPRMLYELARLYDEWPGQDYEGSSCRGALKGWHKHGVCTATLWPYPLDKKNNGVFVRPKAGWDEDAVKRPLGVYYRINKAAIVDMQAAIREIGAIYVMAVVHDGWDALMDAGVTGGGALRSHDGLPFIGPRKDPSQDGSHSFALMGYNERGFVVQNSWGPAWGAGGFGIVSYEDWLSNGTDAWAVALGVPQTLAVVKTRSAAELKASKTAKLAPAAAGFRAAAGAGIGNIGATLSQSANPSDDPWPVHHSFDNPAYQPLRTAEAYTHSLVSGNNGQLMMTDFTRARSDRAGLAREVMVERPIAWLKASAPKAKVLKLALYAHGGLNDEAASIQRIRMLAPYFLANGIYPAFFTWKTGPGETLVDMLDDLKHRVFGSGDAPAGAVWLDKLREQASDAKDGGLEVVARQFARGIWSEMRENAAGGATTDHVLDLAAQMLRELQGQLAASGKTLELHLVGHSAGSILLGHLLDRLAPDGKISVVPASSCELYAAACSSGFAVQHYLGADRAGVLPLNRLHLHALSDANERADGLPNASNRIYGKSLLYLVSRALDDVRKQPLLGMQRALIAQDPAWVDRQWALPAGATVNPDVSTWIKAWPAGDLLHLVSTPKVRNTKAQGQIDAAHGSFDNDIETLTGTLQRIKGDALVSPMEWLDY